MTSDARAVANLILDRFDSVAFSISNKKINKLVYLSHGVCLSRLDKPLIKNHVEAWQHGPVIRVLYDSFKEFEYLPITRKATSMDYRSGEEMEVSYNAMPREMAELALRVCEYFGRRSADDLEELTHAEGSPWSQVWSLPAAQRGLRDRIPNEWIKTYFDETWGKKLAVH